MLENLAIQGWKLKKKMIIKFRVLTRSAIFATSIIELMSLLHSSKVSLLFFPNEIINKNLNLLIHRIMLQNGCHNHDISWEAFNRNLNNSHWWVTCCATICVVSLIVCGLVVNFGVNGDNNMYIIDAAESLRGSRITLFTALYFLVFIRSLNARIESWENWMPVENERLDGVWGGDREK